MRKDERETKIVMNVKRVFTDEELDEMGTRTLDLVMEAIDAGEKDKAKELAEEVPEAAEDQVDAAKDSVEEAEEKMADRVEKIKEATP